ncbi:Yip1 domain-containing protein [Actinacidiphila rubida]|uniref:Yip1 domain-containing protein n=1 Tax=Actinacidiphila rubida TaxID=310780 RepID=A0A1H8PNX8_9ACTN|nr:Yip1 family protein [Actinacidiphila rubida]SEO43719.1 Yip1 domain-containing protein [Actinacidiphila rubida]
MAGFSNRQGRRGRHPQGGGQGAPHAGQGYPGYPAGHPGASGYSGASGRSGSPAYDGSGQAGAGQAGAGQAAPHYDDAPGHTRAFTLGEPTPLAGAAGAGAAPGGGYDPYTSYGDGGYDNVATYRAGQSAAPPAGPRLHWKDLLRGIVLRPGRTFWQMRDHTVWGPALIVTFLYGLVAVFGFDAARSDILSATLSTSIPWVLTTGVAVVLCGLMLGTVTNTLARQMGGDGAWGPTIGLAMLITTLTDAPRLLFALFLGGGNGFVQLVGWATWFACGALLTSMVAKSHDLPWPKALGASAIQLVALLMLFKLPLI